MLFIMMIENKSNAKSYALFSELSYAINLRNF